ncbi:MAG: asparagine synthase (glutamine-hydrolyzing) [Castellaniella sp.]|uniref:asparagine synthase (glutamine-hydrolyzing) n=1 Tax=Castellaniella sp. TaxID=1955812 RepID=UPI001209CECA|nr:asparagine synthase (glutamine-hydrolyzing) [Castellaniella sp.]TAN30546.1 MAG: asparagine synthase (glutamine-hydrolyzing) [Castellaniella sp.]
MCGFSGYLRVTGQAAPDRSAILQAMGGALRHRGPDDQGHWLDTSVDFGVTHQRLSIADLSQAGHQPMLSHDDRYVLAFNGEIYNFPVLRAALEKDTPDMAWRGHSDTEILLEALARWGVEQALTAAVGMFALALWDRQDRTLTLARDRMGEKPLYWGWQSGTLLFGSELTALEAHPAFLRQIDRGALSLLLRYNYIPEPHSIYRGIHKLPAGHLVVLRPDGREPAPEPYWDYRSVVRTGVATPFAGTESEAVSTLESLLMESVAGQMVSDVPLGAFLSGGLDSSTVVALMQKQSSQRVHTYAIGFEDKAYDEATHARAVAAHLGTDHTELYVSNQDTLAVVPELARIYSEPFADSSQIPTYLVSRMARRSVTVALSGDGADELFGGYTHHQYLPRLWNLLAPVPQGLRRCASGLLSPLPFPRRMRKLLDVLDARSREELYWRTRSFWSEPAAVVRGATEPDSLLRSLYRDPSDWRFVQPFATWIMAMEAMDYMPGDVLAKVDRAAMANSLETRAPFLDHRVVEFAARLPLSLKLRNGQGKWLLRQLLYRYVPQAMVDRPKKGFSVPLGAWLRGPLREWAEGLLAEPLLQAGGYFDAAAVRRVWAEHIQGKSDQASKLWSVLMFQAWQAR